MHDDNQRLKLQLKKEVASKRKIRVDVGNKETPRNEQTQQRPFSPTKLPYLAFLHVIAGVCEGEKAKERERDYPIQYPLSIDPEI